MTKIGLISDTHSFLDPKVFQYFKECDEIWHAGDMGSIAVADELEASKPLKAVYGNIDGADLRVRYPENLRFTCEGLRVWITHIGGFPPRYNKIVKPLITKDPPDIFICGHSHVLKIMTDPKLNKMLYINPGAAGKAGFHQVGTLVRFQIDLGKVSNMQVIELGGKSQKIEPKV